MVGLMPNTVWDEQAGHYVNTNNGYTYLPGAGYWSPPASTGTSSGGVPPPVEMPTVTGTDPNELANATYGKPMPLFVGGLARIGGHIVFGPYISNGRGTFGISFGVPANVTGTRSVYEIAFDSKVAWEEAGGFSGIGSPSAAGFKSESFTFRFYPGTLTQAVDPLETQQFGNEGIAYRPQMMLFFENLPLAPFNNKIPFVAAVLGDTTGGADPTDGITLGTAFERVAFSPWGGHTSSTYDASGVDDVIQAMILADDGLTLIELMRRHQRIFRNFDIVQRDKLMALDRGATVDPDIVLNFDHIVDDARPVVFTRESQSSAPRELEFIAIDPAADYTMLPSKAQRPRNPVAITSSVGKDSVTLPIVIDAATRMSMVTYALYRDERARKKVQFSAMPYGMRIEPGDLVALQAIGDGFEFETFKITETLHGANWLVQCTGEAILKCALPGSAVMAPIATYKIASTNSTYTFPDVSLGTPADDRLVVIVALINKTISPVRDIAAVTIDAVATTIHENISNGDPGLSLESNVCGAICSLAEPTAATAQVVVTTSGGPVSGCCIAVYALFGLGSMTPHDSASNGSTGSNPSLSIDVPSNGVVIAGYAGTIPGTLGTTSWVGLNSINYDEAVSPQFWVAGASQSALASETGRTISVTAPATGRELVIAASWA